MENKYFLRYKKKQKEPQHYNGRDEQWEGIDPYDGKFDKPYRDIFDIVKNPFYNETEVDKQKEGED